MAISRIAQKMLLTAQQFMSSGAFATAALLQAPADYYEGGGTGGAINQGSGIDPDMSTLTGSTTTLTNIELITLSGTGGSFTSGTTLDSWRGSWTLANELKGQACVVTLFDDQPFVAWSTYIYMANDTNSRRGIALVVSQNHVDLVIGDGTTSGGGVRALTVYRANLINQIPLFFPVLVTLDTYLQVGTSVDARVKINNQNAATFLDYWYLADNLGGPDNDGIALQDADATIDPMVLSTVTDTVNIGYLDGDGISNYPSLFSPGLQTNGSVGGLIFTDTTRISTGPLFTALGVPDIPLPPAATPPELVDNWDFSHPSQYLVNGGDGSGSLSTRWDPTGIILIRTGAGNFTPFGPYPTTIGLDYEFRWRGETLNGGTDLGYRLGHASLGTQYGSSASPSMDGVEKLVSFTATSTTLVLSINSGGTDLEDTGVMHYCSLIEV